jgi:hypothetical protein
MTVPVLKNQIGNLEATLKHIISTQYLGGRDSCISLSWEIFHRDKYYCIQYPIHHYYFLNTLLDKMGCSSFYLKGVEGRSFQGSITYNSKIPIQSDHCRIPRVCLKRIGEEWMIEDVSVYGD